VKNPGAYFDPTGFPDCLLCVRTLTALTLCAFGEIVSQPILSRALAQELQYPGKPAQSGAKPTLLLLLIFLGLASLDARRDPPGERERRCLHLIACMRALEWVATTVLLGWAGLSYSLLRVSARLTPQPPRLCASWQRTTLK
jgi:hypothetical protein